MAVRVLRAKTIKTFLLVSVMTVSLFSMMGRFAFAEQTDISYGYSKVYGENDWNNLVRLVALEHDAENNLYITGYFYGTNDFDPTSGTDVRAPGGQQGAYLTKMNADGTYGWTKVVDGIGNEYGANVAIGSDGSVYFALQYSSPTDLDPGPGTVIRSSTFYDMAVVKLDSNGNYITSFNTTVTGTGIVYMFDLALDSQSNIYTTGRFIGTADLDPTSGVDTQTSGSSGAAQDIVLTKINANGTYGWSKHTSSTTTSQQASTLAIDSSDNIYIGGRFEGTTDFDPGAGTDSRTNNIQYAAFISKYQANGTYDWTKTIGNASGSTYISSIVIDSSDNIYAGGAFAGTTDFDPGAGTNNIASAGSSDGYLMKFDTGGVAAWTKTIGGTSNDDVTRIALDSSGGLYLWGNFSGTTDLDPGVGTHNESSLQNDFFILKLTSTGIYEWSGRTAISGSGYTYTDGETMTIDNNNNIYYGGIYYDTIDLDPLAGTDSHSASVEDAFITKIVQTTYQQITGLSAGLTAETLSSVDATDNNIPSGTSTTIRLGKTGGVPIADVSTSFNSDLNWSGVTADSDAASGKAFAHNITTAAGAASSFTLYIPKLAGHNGVGICPGATSLSAVQASCANVYYLTNGVDSALSTATINSMEYWKVTGLTGTGGFSTVVSTATAGSSSGALANTGDSQLVTQLLGYAILGIGGVLLIRTLLRRQRR